MFKGQFKMQELAPAQVLQLFAMYTIKKVHSILKREANYT